MIGHVELHAALLIGQRHDGADVVLRHVQMHRDDRLANFIDAACIGNFRRVFDHHDFAVGLEHFIHHARGGRDQVLVEFAFQPFLNNFHVQQPQKAAAKTEAKRLADLRLVVQRCIVELELFERVAQ